MFRLTGKTSKVDKKSLNMAATLNCVGFFCPSSNMNSGMSGIRPINALKFASAAKIMLTSIN